MLTPPACEKKALFRKHREAHVRGPGSIWIIFETRRWTELEEIIQKSEFWCVAVEVGALEFPLLYPRKSILFSRPSTSTIRLQISCILLEIT